MPRFHVQPTSSSQVHACTLILNLSLFLSSCLLAHVTQLTEKLQRERSRADAEAAKCANVEGLLRELYGTVRALQGREEENRAARATVEEQLRGKEEQLQQAREAEASARREGEVRGYGWQEWRKKRSLKASVRSYCYYW